MQLSVSKYARKTALGAFDATIVASAKLPGSTRFLSFDATARVLAAAEGIDVYPVLEPAQKKVLALLKHI